MIYVQMTSGLSAPNAEIAGTLTNVFFVVVIVAAIAVWPFILAHESSRAAREETKHQTAMLLNEIEAHQRTDQELQKAKELAEARSLAKSKYVRGISHELRTPLNAVLGYAQLLENSDAIPANLKHSIRVIRRSGDHLSSLVDGFLDISMIEAGRLQIYRDEVNLSEFLAQIVDMMRLQARDNDLEFAFEAPKTLSANVHADEKRLRQVLLNLLTNAIRYTPEGRITLRIAYSNQVARFDIEDTGIGIPPEDLERIFQPFERIEDPEHPNKLGAGLGLTITKLLTEAMGGEISVKSTAGKGSCFSVRLMLSPVAATQRRETAQRPILGYEGRRRTVLVVDDDPNHVGFISDSLARLGFFVAVEENGRGCLETAARLNPDIILLDISMPGMDGWETARDLRENGSKRIPIVMISADPRHNQQREAAASHHEAYLMKPLRLSALLDGMKKLMNLEWIYDRGEPPRLAPFSFSDLTTEQIPSPPHLVRLRQLGLIGHVRGILTSLDEIGAEQPSAAPTLAYLRRLAEDCDLEGYRNTIEALTLHAS